ncbi:DUF1905 domain-containing protein [Streptomyces olivochromogenes]|uniref:DUF1905 domain-containing protein n=1 Tax=Streptomyces olivochromogenes TaxID=1963 RepID=UPI0036DD5964
MPDSPYGPVFSGRVIEWRGPSPYYFVRVPDEESADIREVAALATYGWGVIPVEARIGEIAFQTSLFPRSASPGPGDRVVPRHPVQLRRCAGPGPRTPSAGHLRRCRAQCRRVITPSTRSPGSPRI